MRTIVWWHAVLGLLILAGCAPENPGDGADGAKTGATASVGTASADAPEARNRTLAEIRADEARHDAEVWAPEVRSEALRSALFKLWDDLRGAEDRWAVLAGREFGDVDPGRLGPPGSGPGGLTRHEIVPGAGVLAGPAWQAWLAALGARWTLDSFEFLPRSFVDGNPARSVYAVTLHLLPRAGSGEERRIQVTADVEIVWSDRRDAFLDQVPASVRVRGGELLRWSGPPVFEAALAYETSGAQEIPPICVYDVDGDGWSDILYPQTNLLFRNRDTFRFEQRDFAAWPLRNYYDALFGDFDGDGTRDFLAAGIGEGDATGRPSLYLFRAEAGGEFSAPPVKVCDRTFESQLCFAAGDIDADGDLDLYIGTYLPPFVAGQVPTPFHDANDGLAGDLLLNDGQGGFASGIEGSGLETHRFRRTFRVSFFDLDGDGDQDLLQTNDFAGTAIFWNDGSGHFVTSAEGKGVDEAASFGMSHTLGDYDRDGAVDLYVTGMYSYTVRRLLAAGLGREDRPDVDPYRMAIAYGNRMYLGQGGGRYVQPPFRDSVANTGWSWGVTSFDVENDGDLDLFVANGHLSGRSIRDYDSRYWRHDVYHIGSKPDPVKNAWFLEHLGNLGKATSWAGYEHDRLLLNEGSGFLGAGFALGLGRDWDSRHVVSEDFDRDGRTDLLIGWKDGLGGRKGFQVMRNRWPDPGNWISVTLRDAPGTSVFGARITVETPGGTQTQVVVAGDSFFAQHSNRRVFGLGAENAVTAVVVTWPGGKTSRLERPATGRDHVVAP